MRILLFVPLFIIACSPNTNVKTLSTSSGPGFIDMQAAFAIIEMDTVSFDPSLKRGHIEIKDSGFTIKCDYDTVIKLAQKEALKIDGNCIVITEHKLPNQWSTCHRIKADVYKIPNPTDYEKEIIWSSTRKLTIEDFKASTENRPFQAATYSSFKYSIQPKALFSKSYTMDVYTFFDCHNSYFKSSPDDSLVLAHEQIHFDMSELYSRKFIKRMMEEARSMDEVWSLHEKISYAISTELNKKQDEYDSEVYMNRELQSKWDAWIREELEKTKEFSKDSYLVKYKK